MTLKKRISPSWWGGHPHCSLPCLVLSSLSPSWLLFIYWNFRCWWCSGFCPSNFSFHIIPLPWTTHTHTWLQLCLVPDDICFSPVGSPEIGTLVSITHLQLDVPNCIYTLPLKPQFLLEWQHETTRHPNQKPGNPSRLSSPLSSFPSCSLVFLSYQLYLL